MSIFGDMAATAHGAHAHFFGETVELTEPGQAMQLVKVVLGKVRTETRIDDNGRRRRVTVRNCRFVSAETVRHDATVTAEGIEWSIDEVLKRTASGVHVKLISVRTHEVSRAGYRGKS